MRTADDIVGAQSGARTLRGMDPDGFGRAANPNPADLSLGRVGPQPLPRPDDYKLWRRLRDAGLVGLDAATRWAAGGGESGGTGGDRPAPGGGDPRTDRLAERVETMTSSGLAETEATVVALDLYFDDD